MDKVYIVFTEDRSSWDRELKILGVYTSMDDATKASLAEDEKYPDNYTWITIANVGKPMKKSFFAYELN